MQVFADHDLEFRFWLSAGGYIGAVSLLFALFTAVWANFTAPELKAEARGIERKAETTGTASPSEEIAKELALSSADRNPTWIAATPKYNYTPPATARYLAKQRKAAEPKAAKRIRSVERGRYRAAFND